MQCGIAASLVVKFLPWLPSTTGCDLEVWATNPLLPWDGSGHGVCHSNRKTGTGSVPNSTKKNKRSEDCPEFMVSLAYISALLQERKPKLTAISDPFCMWHSTAFLGSVCCWMGSLHSPDRLVLRGRPSDILDVAVHCSCSRTALWRAPWESRLGSYPLPIISRKYIYMRERGR